jgi:hypothetical protein
MVIANTAGGAATDIGPEAHNIESGFSADIKVKSNP